MSSAGWDFAIPLTPPPRGEDLSEGSLSP